MLSLSLKSLHQSELSESRIPNPESMAGDGSTKKTRKPYTFTKSREIWTEEEHEKFLEALQLFDRDWKKIEEFVGSKTVIQIRSHAQKYFLKVQKNGMIAHVPPPRPKRKAAHPYPHKASKNGLVPTQASRTCSSELSFLVPEYIPWDGTSMLMNAASSGTVVSQDDSIILHRAEGGIGLMSMPRISNSYSCIGNSNITFTSPEIPKQGKQGSLCHGLPDFAVVYNFIGSVFDPETKGHVQKLKAMDPINVETVMLLMKNLILNLSSSDFEQTGRLLSSYDDKKSRCTSKGRYCKLDT
eukprot:TRINITY_DN1946_c0_g3_i4.p1 TRINITY_DN1946_c0_g3~~TRINITY_DN1946_c0_g3_i4.p1  ORF type:complete len:298 (-),score=49.73 TRINITY_DN1946_c0_g3_i4:125-1018(-)